MDVNLVVDARFKSCPGPVLALAEAVSRAKPGQIVKLLATDPAAPLDIKEWASSIGHKVLEIRKADGVSEIYVEVSG